MSKRILWAFIVAAIVSGFGWAQETPPTPAPAPAPAVAPAPKVEGPIKATIEVDKPTCSLGDDVQVEMKIENTGQSPLKVAELIFEKRSVVFDIVWDYDGKTRAFRYTRISPDILISDRAPPSSIALRPGRSLTAAFVVPALKVSKMKITAVYEGSVQPVISNSVVIDVTPNGNATGIAAALETGKGKIVIDLLPEESPNTVTNFVALVRKGFYNGLTFHRVVDKFVIQTGCPFGLGSGGPGYSLESEKATATTKHELGTVAMAMYEKNGYTGSQFFICLTNLPVLDGKYTVLGKVNEKESLDAVKEIGKTAVDKETEAPKSAIDLTRITIETKGGK